MLYSEFKGKKISALGMGCMRFPTTEDGKIDEARAEAIIDLAIEGGINYFDTAYIYHRGESERFVGKALSKYPRDSYFLATKYPGFSEDNFKDPVGVFAHQLEKCGADHFDFYLFHNVNENNIDLFLSEEYGVKEHIIKMKREGKIRHLGFSAHTSVKVMERFIDGMDGEIEFCQIQLNYLDYTLQRAKEKVEMLNSRGLPIIVMEPLRGGKLAALPDAYKERLQKYGEKSPAAWSFKFLQSTKGVFVTLSGMSSEEVMRENLATFSERIPLSAEEYSALVSLGKDMMGDGTLPCTACGYCTEVCPVGLAIPWLVGQYNEMMFAGGESLPWQIPGLKKEKSPISCIGCGACEDVCPQGIKIRTVMDKFTEMLKKREEK